MAIATFANKVFEVNSNKMYSFDDFQYNSQLQTEKQDVEGAKPSTYNKGPGLDEMNFKIKLDVDFGVNPRREWDEWKSIMNTAIAYPFILGGRPLSNCYFLLVGVSPSNLSFDNLGHILSMDLSLKFEEYVRAGAKKESTKQSKSKSKGKGKSIQGLSDTEFDSLLEE